MVRHHPLRAHTANAGFSARQRGCPAVAERYRDKLSARSRTELYLRIPHMSADRVVRDVQLVGDLTTGLAERDQVHDLLLACRQLLALRLCSRVAAPEAAAPRGIERDEEHEPAAGDHLRVCGVVHG